VCRSVLSLGRVWNEKEQWASHLRMRPARSPQPEKKTNVHVSYAQRVCDQKGDIFSGVGLRKTTGKWCSVTFMLDMRVRQEGGLHVRLPAAARSPITCSERKAVYV